MIKNWSGTKRWYLIIVGAVLLLNPVSPVRPSPRCNVGADYDFSGLFIQAFSSSAPSGMVPELMRAFEMSSDVTTLVTSVGSPLPSPLLSSGYG